MKPAAGDQNPDVMTDQSVSRDSIFLTVGTAVSAKYRGAFCEATVDEVDLSFRLKVQLQNNKDVVSIDQDYLVSGTPLPNNEVTIRIPSTEVRSAGTTTCVEHIGTVLRVTDTSLYTVVFDDGDKRTLRRTQLVIKGERHFKESESLDCLPLTNPEQFRQPVIDRRKNRSGNEDSDAEAAEHASAEDTGHASKDKCACAVQAESTDNIGAPHRHEDGDQFSDVSEDKPADVGSSSVATTQILESTVTGVPDTKGITTPINEIHESRIEAAQNAAYARLLGRLVLVNMPLSRKDHTTSSSSIITSDNPARRRFGPCLIVLPTAMPSINLRSGSRFPQLLVRSFKDNRFFAAPLCHIKRLKRPAAVEMAHAYPSLRTAFERALLWLDRYELPVTWGESATQSLLGVKNWRAAKREQRAALANAPKLTKAIVMKSCKTRRIRPSSPYSSASSADEMQSSTPVKRSRAASNTAGGNRNTAIAGTATANSRNVTKLSTSRKRLRRSDTIRALPGTSGPQKKTRLKLSGRKLSADTRSVHSECSRKIKMHTSLKRKLSSRKLIESTSVVPGSKRLASTKDADSDDSAADRHSGSSSRNSPHSPTQSSGSRPPGVITNFYSSSDSSSSSSTSDVSSDSSFLSETTSAVSSDSESSSSSTSSTSSTGFEARDRWIAQLYRFMDEGGTPINKAPCLANKDLDLYKLYKLVKELGGFHRVTAQMKWGYIYSKLHLPQHFTAGPRNLQAAFKRYLYPLDDISRKLGTKLDELPLARPRHQLVNQMTAGPPVKSGSSTATQVTSASSRVSGTTSTSTPSSITKLQNAQSKSVEKATVVGSSGPTSTTRLSSKDCSPPKVATIEPIMESTSFSSPPVLSPLMLTHEHSLSPDSAARPSRSGSRRDTSATPAAECCDSLPKHSPSGIRTPDKARETDQPRKRNFPDIWKSASAILKFPSSVRIDSSQVNRVIPIGSRVRVRCGDRVAYEAKVLKHIRPQPDLCPRGSSTFSRTGWSSSSELQYRVHYMGWNRRHDEVVSRSRIISIIKWARPVDSLRPPSCSSLNLIVQEPRPKISLSNDPKKRLRAGASPSSGRLLFSRSGRTSGTGSIEKRSCTVAGEIHPVQGKNTSELKGQGDHGTDERDERDDDDVEANAEDIELPEDESDQSQSTETASDIVTTLAPVVRRRRLMFSQPITPNKRTRAGSFASRAPIKREPAFSKNAVTQDNLNDAATTIETASCEPLPIEPDGLNPTRVKLEAISALRFDSTNLHGKRARMNGQSSLNMSKQSIDPNAPDSEKSMQGVSIQSNPKSAIKPEEKLKSTVPVRSASPCEAPKQMKAERGLVQTNRDASSMDLVRRVSEADTTLRKTQLDSTRDKNDRCVLKRQMTYGAKRVSLIKGDKLRSFKRVDSRRVASRMAHKRSGVRSVGLEAAATEGNFLRSREKELLGSHTRIQKKLSSGLTKAASNKTEAVRITRPAQHRIRGGSTERARPASKSLHPTTSSQSMSSKPRRRSVSPVTLRKGNFQPLRSDALKKLLGPVVKESVDKGDQVSRLSKTRASKSIPESHDKSTVNRMKGSVARRKSKTSKSLCTGDHPTSSQRRPRSIPSKRTVAATRTPPRTSRTRSHSSSSVATSSSLPSSHSSSDSSQRSHKTDSESLLSVSATLRENRVRRVCGTKRRPSVRYSRSGGSHNHSRSSSASSSSSTSSDYGNMDALPRLTRSQHRQLLGDTPPGAALQTASPVGALAVTGSALSTTNSDSVKPKSRSNDVVYKPILKEEFPELSVLEKNVETEKTKAVVIKDKIRMGTKKCSMPASSSVATNRTPIVHANDVETNITTSTQPESGQTTPSETSQLHYLSDPLKDIHSVDVTDDIGLSELRSQAIVLRSTNSGSPISATEFEPEDKKFCPDDEAHHDGDEDKHKSEDVSADEDGQSSVHTVSTDPMKGTLFDLTMSPDEKTPLRSSLSVSSSISSTSSSASDSEVEGTTRSRRSDTHMESEEVKNEANYQHQRLESPHDGGDKDEEENEANEPDSSDAEDHEGDNTSVHTQTSRRSGRPKKRIETDGSVQLSAEEKSNRAQHDSVSTKAFNRTTERRRRTSVSSSTDNNISRKAVKRQLQGTSQRSVVLERSPTPTSDSPHYPNSPTATCATGATNCHPSTLAPVSGDQSAVVGPRLAASQRRFGGPFFPIQGLSNLPAEAKCQLLQERMHQIVESWRLAKQYLKDLDQRTNRTRRLRARHTCLDTQAGSATPNSKLATTITSDLPSSSTGPSLDAGTEQRLVVPLQ